MKYSGYAIALNWEILNDQTDIGKWEMYFEDKEKAVNGIGMGELFEALSQLSQDLINVIYVKNLNLFEVVGENYFSYDSDYMAVVKDGQINFFNLKVMGFVELVNWDSFFNNVEDCKELIRRIKLMRENFKGRNKGTLSLSAHYRITKATDQWFDIVNKYYLTSPWANNFRSSLLPQDQSELELFLSVYKGSFSFINPKYINKIVEDAMGYDISSSHSGFILRKKYPSSKAEVITDGNEAIKIINDNWSAWIGEFEFEDLYAKFDLPIDLRNFGYINDDDNWVLILTNAHWNTFKRLFGAKSIKPRCLYKYENKELPKNYALMINSLYEDKEWYKKSKDSFLKEIFKFRTELPFGQSIKSPQCHQIVAYNPETNTFEKESAAPQTYEEIITKLKKQALPMQIGIWTAAYSWSEEVNMILDLGIENVIYGDTDCVKFVNKKELISVIDQHNKEIDQETDKISSKRGMLETSKKIGRWQFEGTFKKFKAIGLKWYLYEINGELKVKAAGAIVENLQNWIKEQKNPFESFNKEMYVPNLFKNVTMSREKGTVSVSYSNYMGEQLKREIARKTNGFII